jgi:hypothetical protein
MTVVAVAVAMMVVAVAVPLNAILKEVAGPFPKEMRHQRNMKPYMDW